VVDEEVIAEVVSKMTGIPLTRMTTEDSSAHEDGGRTAHRKVISQDQAVKAIAKAVRRTRSGFKDPAAHGLLPVRRADRRGKDAAWPRPWRNSCSAMPRRSCRST
jgi:2-methylisocitrate lyase-like PEP mutase family enzyme